MRHSEQVDQLFAALAIAQGEIDNAAKDRTGQVGQQKTRYADLASVRDALRVPLSKNKLAYVQTPQADGAKVTVTTMLGHASGQWIADDLTLTAANASPQAVGSAITYARRYGLSAITGIAPDDDDGAAAQPTHHANGQHRPQQAAPRPQQQVAAPGPVAQPTPAANGGATIDAGRADHIGGLAAKLGLDRAAFSARLKATHGVERLAQLSPAQADEVQAKLEAALAKKDTPKAEPPVPQYVRAFEAKLVGEGLATPGELLATLDDQFFDAYGVPDGWPEESREQVRAACKEFEKMARSAIAARASD